jgi:hypothetical protein
MNGQTAITHVFTTDTSGRPVSTTYQDNTCQTSCFAGEAQLQWDPCGNLTSMTDASGTLLASFEYDKAYSYKTNEYNPNQIEIPFQFDGRDGTVTPTYGGATPINIDIQIKNGQSFYFRNTKPLQAMRIFKCYVNGYSPDPMSPADGGPSDGCNEEEECGPECDELNTDSCCKHKKGSAFRYICFAAEEWAEDDDKSNKSDKELWAECMQNELAKRTEGEEDTLLESDLIKHALDVLDCIANECEEYSGPVKGYFWTASLYASVIARTTVGKQKYSYFDECCND